MDVYAPPRPLPMPLWGSQPGRGQQAPWTWRQASGSVPCPPALRSAGEPGPGAAVHSGLLSLRGVRRAAWKGLTVD